MVPNAIIIAKDYGWVDGDKFNVSPMSTNPPNLKKNRAYYLFAEQTGRLYHVTDYGIVGENMGIGRLQLILGNSFVPKKVPEIRKPVVYLPLYAFGMQQISPGVLVKIEAQEKGGTENA